MPTKIKEPEQDKIYTEEELEYNVLYKVSNSQHETLYLKCFDNEHGGGAYRIVWFENGRAGVCAIKDFQHKFKLAPVGTQLLMEQVAGTSL